MLGIYVGVPEDTLLQYKQEALGDLGKAVTSYSDSGTSVNKQFGMPPAQPSAPNRSPGDPALFAFAGGGLGFYFRHA